jgi:PIN domain nuclease of toxin-antitoxin system
MNCLLDTCALLWLADEPRHLSPAVRQLLSNGTTAVHVSAVSALELGIKVARAKLQLPMPVSQWFPALCKRNDLHPLPVDIGIAAASTELPPLHRDPFDRLLIATAIQRGLALVTPDNSISQYPNLKTLW